jgi:adenylate cyclase
MSETLSKSWLEMPDGSRFELRGSTSLGRSPDNTLVLDDGQVSRRHALIQPQGEGEFWLVDLGSANGSYVNERRIFQPVALQTGDVIRLYNSHLVFGSEKVRSTEPAAASMMASTMMAIRTSKCWMMMVDIIGSTKMAQETSAEEWPLITGNWFRSCREIIEGHQGHMMKYLGDGFFCYWLDNKEAASQVRDALTTLRQMQEQSAPPFRLVLHLGSAVLGSVPTMAELNLHGQEVNFTFRIEKIAGGLRCPVLLSESANDALGMETQFIAAAPVDGFRGSFRFFAPLGS